MKPKTGNLYRYYSTQKEEIKRNTIHFKAYGSDLTHCAACIAESIIGNRKWNTKAGSEHFAAILAVIVFNKFY
jgi:hypothetical protein